jgi:hypothetical protein
LQRSVEIYGNECHEVGLDNSSNASLRRLDTQIKRSVPFDARFVSRCLLARFSRWRNLRSVRASRPELSQPPSPAPNIPRPEGIFSRIYARRTQG